ncbi:MAG: VOC family protein [Thermoplasmata archaeon]
MAAVEKYLSYSGIRVTDLDRSLKFYTELFGLTEVARGDISSLGRGAFVLLQDPWSGQKLELNWYSPESRFAVPYLPGEGLDHIGFRVADLPRFMDNLRREGVERAGGSADFELPTGLRVAFVKDPDGNWIALFDVVNKSMPTSPGKGY